MAKTSSRVSATRTTTKQLRPQKSDHDNLHPPSPTFAALWLGPATSAGPMELRSDGASSRSKRGSHKGWSPLERSCTVCSSRSHRGQVIRAATVAVDGGSGRSAVGGRRLKSAQVTISPLETPTPIWREARGYKKVLHQLPEIHAHVLLSLVVAMSAARRCGRASDATRVLRCPSITSYCLVVASNPLCGASVCDQRRKLWFTQVPLYSDVGPCQPVPA